MGKFIAVTNDIFDLDRDLDRVCDSCDILIWTGSAIHAIFCKTKTNLKQAFISEYEYYVNELILGRKPDSNHVNDIKDVDDYID